jgi:hypothetical protein
VETWKLQHKDDTKAGTQLEGGQERLAFLLHEKSEHLALDHLDREYIRSKSFPKFFILQTQPFLLVEVSRRVLIACDERLGIFQGRPGID